MSDNYYTQGAGLGVRWQRSAAQACLAGVRQEVYSPDNITTSDVNALQGDRP